MTEAKPLTDLPLVPGKALLTGASGWLGSRLALFLDREPVEELRCLVPPGQEPALAGLSKRAVLVSGDLRDPEACRRFCSDAAGATLYHCSGLIHPRRVRELYEVNAGGTANLLTAASAAGLRRAVVVSSNSPCGTNPHPDHLFDEDSPYAPYLHYGRSKMRMERWIRGEAEHRGLEWVIVRAPWFYGPNQPPRQSTFFRMIRSGGAPVVGSGENLRSMVYIDNLCEGLLLAAGAAPAAGRVYWIADERPYAWNAILDTIERLLADEFGKSVTRKRLRLPGFAAELALAGDSLLQALGLYNQKLHVLSETNKTIACSIDRARKELGYAPKVALEEGMRRSIAWCLERGIEI